MSDVVSQKFDLHDSQRPRMKYEQLKGHLLTELRMGRLKPGDALPTEVELAEMLCVARNTVRHALSELDRDGFIRRIRGKGTFVSEEISTPVLTDLASSLWWSPNRRAAIIRR